MPRKKPPGGPRRPRNPERESSSRPHSRSRGPREGRADRKSGSSGPGRASRDPQPADSEPVRLQAYLARAGVASRRASEALIEEGKVQVNGHVVTEMGTKVTPGEDRVAVSGEIVELATATWIALHKPRGYVTTRDDPRDRRTVYDLVPQHLHHLFHVGRLDRQSEGLLLLTNEGVIAHRLLHPSFAVDKEYIATVEGEPEYQALEKLVEGVRVEGEILRAESVEILPGSDRDLTRLRLVLREGRNREVRRMFEVIGHPVQKLLRRRFGPVKLGDLRRGQWRSLTVAELRALGSAARG